MWQRVYFFTLSRLALVSLIGALILTLFGVFMFGKYVGATEKSASVEYLADKKLRRSDPSDVIDGIILGRTAQQSSLNLLYAGP